MIDTDAGAIMTSKQHALAGQVIQLTRERQRTKNDWNREAKRDAPFVPRLRALAALYREILAQENAYREAAGMTIILTPGWAEGEGQ